MNLIVGCVRQYPIFPQHPMIQTAYVYRRLEAERIRLSDRRNSLDLVVLMVDRRNNTKRPFETKRMALDAGDGYSTDIRSFNFMDGHQFEVLVSSQPELEVSTKLLGAPGDLATQVNFRLGTALVRLYVPSSRIDPAKARWRNPAYDLDREQTTERYSALWARWKAFGPELELFIGNHSFDPTSTGTTTLKDLRHGFSWSFVHI